MANETTESVMMDLEPSSLIALTPTEMAAAQASLGDWCAEKIKAVTVELADAEVNLESAKKHKWKSSGFQSLVQRTRSRLTFYEKTKAAVEAGYLVIPNFPIDAFAVRRRKNEGELPDGRPGYHSSSPDNLPAMVLPVGEGEYANPVPSVYKKTIGKDDKGADIVRWFRHSYQAVEFPVTVAKPHVIDAAQKAMSLRIFDRIGLVGETAPRGDPILVGQVLRKEGWNERRLTFFIGWWFNWRDL